MTSATIAATETALKLLPPFWADLLRSDIAGADRNVLGFTGDQLQRLTQLAREKLQQLFTYDPPGCC